MYFINAVMDLPFVSFERGFFLEDAMILQYGQSLGGLVLNNIIEMVCFQICIQPLS
jgi:hypothetical protein